MEKIFSHLHAMSIVTLTVFKGNLFLSLLFIGAFMDLDLIDTEELRKIVSGKVKSGKEEDQMSVKVLFFCPFFLTICLLLVYFVSAAGCHCFDLLGAD